MNIDTNTDFLGTCPACFGQHVVRKGGMIKHGWMEVGGREVGVYGKAYHTGKCYGVGLLPFEVSCSGTESFLATIVLPMLDDCRKLVAHLQTRPVLMVGVTDYVKDDRGHIIYNGRRAMTTTVVHECSPTNEFGAKKNYSGVTRYDSELANALLRAEMDLTRTEAHVEALRDRITTWAPTNLPVYETKAEIVHFVSEQTDPRRPRTFCGSDSRGLGSTSTKAEVTCTRCLKALATVAAEKAARDAVAADRDAFIAFVKAAGKPVSGKEVRTALGWDIKRWNKASDRSYNYGIESTYEKNTEYFTAK